MESAKFFVHVSECEDEVVIAGEHGLATQPQVFRALHGKVQVSIDWFHHHKIHCFVDDMMFERRSTRLIARNGEVLMEYFSACSALSMGIGHNTMSTSPRR